MINQFIIGSRYWCFQDTNPANKTPVLPWVGRLKLKGDQYILVPDDDEEEFIYATRNNLFSSRKDAVREFIQISYREIGYLTEEINIIIDRVKTLV